VGGIRVWQLVDFLTGHTTSFIYLFLFLGLFVGGLGAPIPEDLLLLLGGFLSWAGYTNLYTTIVISIVGALVGDYLVFYIGRKWGSNVLNHPRFRRWLTQRRLKKIHHHFENYGGKTVFFARFFAGFRMAVYLVAGAIRMNAQKFVLTDMCGAVLSVPLVTLLGYFLSGKIDAILRTIHGARIIATLVLVLAILALIAYRKWFRKFPTRRREKPQEAEGSSQSEELSTTKGGTRENA
jgi:membrane protein DedA with SNARE-associated domain